MNIFNIAWLSFILCLSGSALAVDFDVTLSPPILDNPIEISIPSDAGGLADPLRFVPDWAAYSACGAGGIYLFNLNLPAYQNKDFLITFDGDAPLAYPVLIWGGRNVIVRGLDIKLETEAGNEAGALVLHTPGHPEVANPHPIVPTCRGLGLNRNSNSTHWIEGLHLDTNGHDADGIVIAGPASAGSSKVVIQNALIEGIEGYYYLHGDILQTQSGHLNELAFENVTMRQASEGVTLSYPVNNLILRNVDYDTDTRFDSDDPGDSAYGGAVAATNVQETYTLENLYVKYKNEGEFWVLIQDQHFTSPAQAGTVVYGVTTVYNPEVIYNAAPPGGDYAPANLVGRFYEQQISEPVMGECDGVSGVNINDVICVINQILNSTSSTVGECDGQPGININDVICTINEVLN